MTKETRVPRLIRRFRFDKETRALIETHRGSAPNVFPLGELHPEVRDYLCAEGLKQKLIFSKDMTATYEQYASGQFPEQRATPKKTASLSPLVEAISRVLYTQALNAAHSSGAAPTKAEQDEMAAMAVVQALRMPAAQRRAAEKTSDVIDELARLTGQPRTLKELLGGESEAAE